MRVRACLFVATASALAVLARLASAASATAPTISFHWIQMVDSSHGYALSGDNAYHLLWTSDGGRRWIEVTPGKGTWHPLSTLSVFGQTRLFSRRLGPHTFAVVRSTDGGRSWKQSRPFANPHAQAAGQPFALDARHLFLAVDEGAAVGSQGEALYTSSDGGGRWRLISETSWSRQRPGSLPLGCDKNGFAFATTTHGWAGGNCAGGPPFLYRTDDGGRTWHRQTLPAPQSCACNTSTPAFFSATVGAVYVAGFANNGSPSAPVARVLWTYDGGRRWRGHVLQLGRVEQVSFANARSVWVTVQKQTKRASPVTLLLRTDDAGADWRTVRLSFNADDYRFDALSATTAFGFKVGVYSNTLVVSHDGGRNWQTIHASLTP